ncbi:23S rRNA (pseudouridine(1915)-N(3))-methyltransferase RlmH [Candidatus Thioglobus sp.]|nr:23S rRNA (pseudouridine(1915)-N(3))-methyltransferase RlmH [Candidatus Thioglobus sp.]MDA8872128.1 23S rRNA (pseudouridine(1915)-N(3))-methyltransferase RlmH [Candidatus Thioglobus sp.]
MKINLITIGKKMPNWINLGIEHYQKQLPSYYNFTITSLESQNRKSSNSEDSKNLEAKLLLAVARDSTLLVAFDEAGTQKTSKQISKSIESWQLDGESVALFIGGADGLSSEIKQKCHQVWGLSNLTMTHSIARLLVVEQIYRGHSLLNNHPYHRE